MPFGPAGFGLILLGLTLGMRHATDPDHVIAVTAILTRERRLFGAIRIGLAWGLGHSATVLSVGMAIIFLKVRVPARLGLTLEFAVALVLILLGLGAARETLVLVAKKLGLVFSPEPLLTVHSHQHTHQDGGRFHIHRHVHAHSMLHEKDSTPHHHMIQPGMAEMVSARSMAKSFTVGLVHGLAGSAAIALLVTAAIPSPCWASLYMIIFCVGVMIGMMLITAAVGTPFVFAAQRLTGVHRRLGLAAGCLSFAFGVFLAYQIGIADQLFGATPHWFPH